VLVLFCSPLCSALRIILRYLYREKLWQSIFKPEVTIQTDPKPANSMFTNWNKLWNCTHIRHPTDEQLRQLDICWSRTSDHCFVLFELSFFPAANWLTSEFAYAPSSNHRKKSNERIDQFRYIKIQPKTIDLNTRFWGINPTNSVLIPQSFVMRSIVLDWILISRNWSIS